MTRIATCQCGQLRVVCTGEPVRISVCHCLDCQRRTGSAFGAQARFPEDAVRIEGETRLFTRTGDTGKEVSLTFCPRCGSTVCWRIETLEGFVAVALGAFADPAFPSPFVEVYENRRHAWVRAEICP
jgi:hypothetical protein